MILGKRVTGKVSTSIAKSCIVLVLLTGLCTESGHAQRTYCSSMKVDGVHVSVTVKRVDPELTCTIDIHNRSDKTVFVIDPSQWAFDRDYWFWRDDRYIVDGSITQPVGSPEYCMLRLNPNDSCASVFAGKRRIWPDTSVVRVVVDLVTTPADVERLIAACASQSSADTSSGACVPISYRTIESLSIHTVETCLGICRNCCDANWLDPP